MTQQKNHQNIENQKINKNKKKTIENQKFEKK